MVSFGEFIINLFEKIGLYYVFSAIFIFIIVYVLFSAFLKSFLKDTFNDKQINVISSIFGFVTAILSISIYGVAKLLSYFLSFMIFMILVILFTFIVMIFALEKKPTLSDSNLRNVFIAALSFVVAFIFISFYFAYENYILPIAYGGGEGGIMEIFRYVLKPEIIVIPFLFAILGISIMSISTGTTPGKEKK